MIFSEKLQKLRKEKGLSQEQLAELLEVSRQAVSKWESGQTYPEIDKLIKLSELFNVTLDELVRDKRIEQTPNDDVKYKENEDDEDDDDLVSSLMIGGLIVGTAIGLITDNFMWGSAGAFITLGVSYIIKGIKKRA